MVSYSILNLINISVNKEILSAVIGLLLTGLAYLFIKKKDSKLRESRQYIPVITKVVDKINI
ncbi:SoxR reducing system RseC family protein [Paraclostridium bifermentans]|uniref:SoxR reducing system RseC family protein n=1 Tax=Paraclostridium bifermentans TaxID=1490 RepID=A0ABY8R519_PARBF|nr:SoxR reducing system RseC family protein [Paraclostridium bifermentans]